MASQKPWVLNANQKLVAGEVLEHPSQTVSKRVVFGRVSRLSCRDELMTLFG